MTSIKIEDIVDHLDHDIRRALEDAVKEVIPGVHFDPYNLFRTFKRKIGNKCSTWEAVPDHFVEKNG